MKWLILILPWIVLTEAEYISKDENDYDLPEAPTLEPIDYSNLLYQLGLAQNPNSRILISYNPEVSEIQVEKENVRPYFRVRKPVARRKVFHLQRERIPVAEPLETLVKTESTPPDYIMKNDMVQDKHIDYVLDKLPELVVVTQESIIEPLLQDMYNKNKVAIPIMNETETAITAFNDKVEATSQESTLSTDVRLNSQKDKCLAEPGNCKETNKSDALLLNKNSDDTALGHTEEYRDVVPSATVEDFEATQTYSTPKIEFLLLSDIVPKLEMNDTIDNPLQIVVEEFIVNSDTLSLPIVKNNVSEARVLPKNELQDVKQIGDKTELPYPSIVYPITETTDIVTSPTVVTETPEPSSEIRLGGVKGHLISDSKQNFTLNTKDGSERLKVPRRRLRRRKLRRNMIVSKINTAKINDTEAIPSQNEDITTITAPATIIDTTSTTTLLQLVQTSTPRSRFTLYQDIRHNVRGQNNSLPYSNRTYHRTTRKPSQFRQNHVKSVRQWNRNKNITPTVINPYVEVPKPPLISELPTNDTKYIESVSSSPALEENRVSSGAQTYKQNNTTTTEEVEISPLNPVEKANTTSNSPRRIRFRNKLRQHIRTSTRPTMPTTVSTSDTIEVISTTPTLLDTENTAVTKKFKRPPPPPPTLSPWSDGFGK